jgi:restriction system protein
VAPQLSPGEKQAMEKPLPPTPESFGVTAVQVGSLSKLIEYGNVYCAGAVIVGFEAWMALSTSASSWAKYWVGYLVAGFFMPIFLIIPAMFVSLLIWPCLDLLVQNFWPEYKRVKLFSFAQKRYQAALAEYNLWVRRQAESYWRALDGISFERELGQLFKRLGFAVSTTPHTADGGIDLILEKAGQKTVVQCKAHASKVPIGTARELVASMSDFGVEKGILATISGVTKPVREYASKRNIEILDLDQILHLQRSLG